MQPTFYQTQFLHAILYLFTNLMSRIVDCNKSKIRESLRIYSTVYLMARMAFHCSYIRSLDLCALYKNQSCTKRLLQEYTTI